MKIINRHYYKVCSLWGWTVEDGPYKAESSGFYPIFSGGTFADSTQTLILADLFYTRYYDSNVGFIDKEDDSLPTADEEKLMYDKIEARFKSLINITRERYETVISSFTQEKANLLIGLKNTQTTLFNDTPQSGGDFTTDLHTTTATKTTNVSENPVIERIAQLDLLIQDWYGRWLKELSKLIIED